jgi:hypothetical protein
MKCTRKQVRGNKLEIGTMGFESVQSFKYLGSAVNQKNAIEKEIKESIIDGNKDFYANRKMFQSKLFSSKSKLKLYRTSIRSIVIYASETWAFKENSIQKLMIFEGKILRKIFGPPKELNGLWRIKTNEELNDPRQQKNIIRFIKSQRLKWLDHVERMPKRKRSYKNL